MDTLQKSELTKYEVVMADLEDGLLSNQMLAGFAVQFEGENHYVVRLTMFPNNPYYLCKNKDSQSNYTAFAKIVKDMETGATRFQNPVGSGRLLPHLKSHLEIRFPLIKANVFMNLFPRN